MCGCKVASEQPGATAVIYIYIIYNRPKEEDFTNKDTESIVSTDDDMENISMVLQSNLQRTVETGKDVELGIFENMMADNFDLKPTTLDYNCIEKVGIKTLR